MASPYVNQGTLNRALVSVSVVNFPELNVTTGFFGTKVALLSFDPHRLHLEPGLYDLSTVFGCWHDQQVLGPGRLTILIQAPGEQALRPAKPDELVRPR